MNGNLSTVFVFFQGVASFLSPCIFPLMPVYLSYLAGDAIDEIENKDLNKKIIINALGFLLGLSIVFISLGATATALGKFLYFNSTLMRKIGGVFIVVFGIHHLGIINIKALNKEKRFNLKVRAPKFVYSVLLGMAFSFGWTPCNSVILGSVLVIAASYDSYLQGIYLLSIYSLGFSIPFFITALFVNMFMDKMNNIDKYLKYIKIVSGILIIIMGILVYTNKIIILSSIFS